MFRSFFGTVIRCQSVVQSSLRCASATTATATTATVLPAVKADKALMEEDTEKLCKYACINYLKDGSHPEIKPDSEYPSWLFEMELGPARKLEDLDPEKDGWAYWRRLHKVYYRHRNKHRNLMYSSAHVQHNWKTGGPVSWKQNNKPKLRW